jgi:hypothetical protein
MVTEGDRGVCASIKGTKTRVTIMELNTGTDMALFHLVFKISLVGYFKVECK